MICISVDHRSSTTSVHARNVRPPIVCGVSAFTPSSQVDHLVDERSKQTVSIRLYSKHPNHQLAASNEKPWSKPSMSVIPLAPASIEFLPFRPSFHLPLRFNVNSTLPDDPDLQACRFHLDIPLPDALFIDPDEVRDALRPGVEWSLEPDVIDIERPVQVDAEPTHLYLSLPGPLATGAEAGSVLRLDTNVKVPMHARYLEPNDHGRETVWLFAEEAPLRGAWVCRADEQHGESSKYRHAKSKV